MHRFRGRDRGSGPPEKSQIYRVSPDPLKNHKHSLLGHHRHAIKMAFRWWADDGLLIVVFK